MVQLARDETQRGTTEVLLTADYKVESKLALRWIDSLIRQPPGTLAADDFVTLLGWRRDLILTGKGLNSGRVISPRGPMLLAEACRDATARDPAWWRGSGDSQTVSSYASSTKKSEPSPWEKLPGELWDAFTAPTNLAGSGVGAGSVADALVKSLPLRWQVTLQRGTWELYDENATQRNSPAHGASCAWGPRRVDVANRSSRRNELDAIPSDCRRKDGRRGAAHSQCRQDEADPSRRV